ncbi:MAG: hypothetical protein NE327_13660 [Lentisphaeraceae bacterium]|nr:hypothetical protein [Lentisphaeraceae bacterium]
MKEKVSEVLKSKEGLQIVHQNFSASCFNKTWDFISKESLSEEEKEDMIATSYASLWHWKQRTDYKDENLSIAYWQLGRVQCLAGKAQTASEFGEKCLKASEKLGPFYIGYAYEVMLNSAIITGDKNEAVKYLKLAEEQLALVEDKDNHSYLKEDLSKLMNKLNSL